MKRSTLLTALALALVAPGLMAQEATGTLLGTVKDDQGKPIAGATLHLTGDQLLGERTLTTDKNGTYRIPLLPSGNYEVSVFAQGYIGQKATLFLSAGSNIRQDLVVRPVQQASATVEIVAASAAQFDKTETATKTVFNTAQLTALTGTPSVVGTSVAYNALAISPGVVGGVQYASIRGGSQQATNYVVDGISSRDNVTGQARLGDTVLDDSIEETAVIQSPLNAKYGGSSSGLVSVVTKHGTNTFHGTFRAKLSDQAWSALTIPYQNRLGNPTGSANYNVDDLNRTWEITFSGPIIKDHLTFFWGTRLTPTVNSSATAFDPTQYGLDAVRYNGVNYPTNLYQAGQLESAPQKMTYNQYNLYYQINDNHSLEAEYTEAPQVNPDVQYSDVTPDTSIMKIQTTMEKFEKLSYRGIIGSNQILTVHIGKNSSDTQFPSGPGTPVIVMAGPDANNTAGLPAMASLNDLYDATVNAFFNSPMTNMGWVTSGAAADTQPDRRTTESFVANWNIILNWKGMHSLDVGVERENPIWGTVSANNSYPNVYSVPGQLSTDAAALNAITPGMGANAGQYIVFPFGATIDGYTYNNPNDPYVRGEYGYPGVIPTLTHDTGALQSHVSNPTDSLYVNDNWTINDNWSVMAGLRYDRMRLMDATGTRSDSRTLSPRLDVKWDINGDQSRIVELTYGQFRGLFNARFYRNAVVTRLGNQETYYWNQGTGMQLVNYAAVTNPANYGYLANFTSNAMYAIDHNWKPENDNEITLGYHRNYGSGGYWRATLVYRKWTDLSNVLPDLSHPITITDGSLSETSYTRVLTNDANSTRQYKGLEFEFQAPLNANLLLGGNFTWSSLWGNNVYGDGQTFTGSIGNLGTQGDFRDRYQALGYSQSMTDPSGYLQMSLPVVFKAYLSYHVESGRTKSVVSLQGDYTSGQRVSLINQVNQDPNLIPFAMTDTNIPSSIPMYFNGRGQFSQPDSWHLNLTYNFDVALKNKVHFFSQMAIVNLLNSQIPIFLNYGASNTPRPMASYANGFRATGIGNYGVPVGNSTTVVDGARAINIDLGLKF